MDDEEKKHAEADQIKFLEDWAKERGFITADAITGCTGWNHDDWTTLYEGYISYYYGKLKNRYADVVFPQSAICETSYDYMKLMGRNESENILPSCSQNLTYEKGMFYVGENYTVHGMYRCEGKTASSVDLTVRSIFLLYRSQICMETYPRLGIASHGYLQIESKVYSPHFYGTSSFHISF